MWNRKVWATLAAAGILLAGSAALADDDAMMDVDNHSASFTGSWGTSTAKILYYGDNYRFAWGCGGSCATPTAVATFTTKQTADIAGYYNVYVRHSTASNREETAQFKIYSVVSGSPTYRGTCYIDQTRDGGEWLYCNNVYLPNGSYGRVTLGNEYTNTNEVVIADGVRFVRTGVDGTDILDNSVTSSDIANNSVSSADILNSTIYDYDMADEAGVDYAGGDQHLLLSSADTVARANSVTAPTSGYIIVSASGYWDHDTGTSAIPRCSITTGTSIDFTALTLGEVSSTVDYLPFSVTRTYYVSSSGTYTYNLVCDMSSGTAYVDDTHMNSIFVPTRY